MTRIIAVAAEDADRLLRLFGDLPEDDRTFTKGEVVLANHVWEAWSGMEIVGVSDALE